MLALMIPENIFVWTTMPGKGYCLSSEWKRAKFWDCSYVLV